MESTASNTSEFKQKTRIPYSDSSSRDSTSTATTSGQWHDNHREHRRDYNKIRDRSRERGWNKDRSMHGNRGSRENFREDESQIRLKEEPVPSTSQQQPAQQQQQAAPSTFTTYGYGVPPDHFNADSNRRALNNMFQYSMMTPAMNHQWGVTTMDRMAMTQNNLPVNPTSTGIPMATGMEMNPNSGAGINPFTFMGMGDNVFGMMGMGNYCQYGMMNGQENVMVGPVKEVIHLVKSVLYPPNPNAPPPTTRDKPLGCKTVFVGGLPENATEEIIKEVFERCGEIVEIRMSKKNFCHIRFASESYVEHAIFLSGYRIKIENKDEAPFTGRLHVDYAQARDDQYEYECQQRALIREARHRERLEQEYNRPPTPPPVVHYTDHEAGILGEKLREEETFQQAVFILITWLERGECIKRNSAFFYSMIQSTNSHVRRLMNEKLKYEDELNKAKLILKQQMQGILLQFNEIGKVFNAASLQKVWDHFTNPQRKNIELWKKQTEEIKNAHVEEVLSERIEDEMEVSDDEDSSKKSQDGSANEQKDAVAEELNKLREENDSLRCQLEAAQNETMLLRSENEQDKDIRELHLKPLRQAVQQYQNQVLSLTQKRTKDKAELKELRLLKVRRRDNLDKDDDHRDCENDRVDIDIKRDSLGFSTSVGSSSGLALSVTESEARLVGLISTFLNVHPFGASIDYICSYLHQIDCTIRARDVESLMKRFPSVFKEESTGIGASFEKKWTFFGFKVQI